MRLHLGCGERYLAGYVNIDQPPASHTVQSQSVADRHADLTALRYDAGSIDEVRLHHVFEHFPRPVALALVASWATWLRPGGILHVEVPDFDRTARSVLSLFASRRRRLAGIRHLFGSHEAPWAVHWEGWSAETLRAVFQLFGIEAVRVRRARWKHTYNVEAIGRRGDAPLDPEQVEAAARAWLDAYLVDHSPTELRLLDVWMEQFRKQFEASRAPD